MSDIEASPTKNRNRETLHLDDYNYQEREPKCINSLCNLINSRLKVLENEILAQHKVWESIQREVDEVKSLIEDCTSTCGSSSSSAQENESENVDSALESHKTCNSVLWGKLKQAEESLEEKKSLMRVLSNDVTKLKNSKKRCSRKHSRSKSNVDLILEVTNGLHVLKCDDCKFCSEHLDFREGLLSAVIELIHFTEKNYNHSLEDNKALKSCLQKIYVKTKSCLLHSQIYLKSSQHHPPFDTENHTVSVDNIYTSFEEFCQHFQNLQDELLQLRQILLAAEENHLDELFQDNHSANCICYNFMRKGDAQSSNSSEKLEVKFSKSSQKSISSYEKKLKSLTYGDENYEDADVIFDSEQIFKLSESEISKQLENLRNRIYEAVRTIRDVEVEENDDANLISMVGSLAEECGALRQEVSYLRNVRQEKKRAWNKLQCFIMDAERKLKGNRSVSDMKEIIRDLGHIISSGESSSLDETILYMYSNQLEWMEKLSTVNESPSEEEVANQNDNVDVKSDGVNVSTQTLLHSSSKTFMNEYSSLSDLEKCDIGIQVEGVFESFTTDACKPYESSSFSEINREIYVVPEVMEESDSCYSSYSIDNKETGTLEASSSKQSSQDTIQPEESATQSLESDSDLSEDTCKSVIPVADFSGSFSTEVNYVKTVPEQSPKNFSLPLLNMSDVPFSTSKSEYWNMFPDQNYLFNSPMDNSLYIYTFMNQYSDLSNKFNSLFYNLMRRNVNSVEIPDEGKNWSCIILQSNDSPLSLNASKAPVSYLPHQSASTTKELESDEFKEVVSKYSKLDTSSDSEVICREIIFKSSVSHFPTLSSNSSDGELLPNTSPNDFGNTSNQTPFSEAANIEDIESQIIPDSVDYESCTDYKDIVRERRPLASREGTFIVESPESLRLNKQNDFDENMYYTAILTTLVSSGVHTNEKSYVLFEVCKRLKLSVEEFPGEDELSVASSQEKHNVQHFVLCETDQDSTTKSHQIVSDICHIIFCKRNTNLENKHLLDISSGNNTSFSPLVPQYLPLETFSYDSFEPLSLTHNCEIYMSNIKSNLQLSNEDENSMFIPKNFLKFKTYLPSKDNPPYEIVDESVQKSYVTNEYAIPFQQSSAEMIASNGTESVLSDRRSAGSQTDSAFNVLLQEDNQENSQERTQDRQETVQESVLEDQRENIEEYAKEDNKENVQENNKNTTRKDALETVQEDAQETFSEDNQESTCDSQVTVQEDSQKSVPDDSQKSALGDSQESILEKLAEISETQVDEVSVSEQKTESAESSEQRSERAESIEQIAESAESSEQKGESAEASEQKAVSVESSDAKETTVDETDKNVAEETTLEQTVHCDERVQHVTAQTEPSVSEISLLDEIKALKENLSHQNAVLQRLKEEIEVSNMELERKENQLEILQVEHSRLNEIMLQKSIKEVEDKRCQTEMPNDLEKYENLKKEIIALRRENMQHNEKIISQNRTIQHVKAQLCSSITHLKTLKESATKQLKKQNQQMWKSLKIKQQLQETKITLEKKCEEIEKKNEMISDQEFQIHEVQARLDSTLEELNKKTKRSEPRHSISIQVENDIQTPFVDRERKEEKRLKPVTEQDVVLKRHSEELMELQTKLLQLESVFSNKKDYHRVSSEESIRSSNELKVPTHMKEGNIWKLLMISEQSYLSLLNKLSESLQISDLRGSVTLMHSSWLNVDELADARRQDHKRILQSLDKLKRSIRYLQETHQQEQRRQNAESAGSEDKKAGLMCHSDEMHFQYLCEVLQRAQENLLKDYSQKKISSHQRSIVSSTGSIRTTRHANSRERRIPLELKNGKILALLDDKVNHKDLLPNKHDFTKMEPKAGSSTFKSKSSS